MAKTSDSKLHTTGDMGAAYLAQVSADIRSAFNPELRAIPATLMLLPLTPEKLHVYWQLNDHLLTLAEGQDMILLFRQLSPADPEENSRLEFEIPLSGQQASNRREVLIPNPTYDYVAELGFHDSRRRFISLLKSNRVHTSGGQPRSGGSPAEWAGQQPGSSSSRPGLPSADMANDRPMETGSREQEIDRQIRDQLRTMGYFSGPAMSGLPFSNQHPPARSPSGRPQKTR